MGKKRGRFIPHSQIKMRDKLKESVPKKSNSFNLGATVVKINLKDLPSKFLPYPSDSKISYRPYYYEEIKNHDQSKNLSYREEVDFVLSGVETNFDKYDLTLSDYLYINLLRRMSNVGGGDYDIVAKYRCKKCNNFSRNVFKASDILIDYLEVPALPVTVTFSSNKKYSFTPLTIGKYIEMVEEGFKNKAVSMLSKCCISAPYEEIYEFIRTITEPEDIYLIEQLDSILYHSLKPMKLKCSHVDKEYFEKDGWTLDKLMTLNKSKNKDVLLNLFNKYDIKFVEETDMVSLAFRDLVKKMALVKEIPCNHENTVELDGGDLFIGPFREYQQLMENRVCYGS